MVDVTSCDLKRDRERNCFQTVNFIRNSVEAVDIHINLILLILKMKDISALSKS